MCVSAGVFRCVYVCGCVCVPVCVCVGVRANWISIEMGILKLKSLLDCHWLPGRTL